MEPNSRHAALIGAATAALAAASVVSGGGAVQEPATAPGIVVEAHIALFGHPVGGPGGPCADQDFFTELTTHWRPLSRCPLTLRWLGNRDTATYFVRR
ncbi:hypothetical protein [Kitasatospora purpeofusca]|uniref:hypothetical protein n=1 Tax=Kitasatospora purpeofusca TaxID=67352 RepID=UPI0037FBC03C